MTGSERGSGSLMMAVGVVLLAVTGFVVVKWLLGYIKHHRFTGFAVYRMALGAALLLFLPAGH